MKLMQAIFSISGAILFSIGALLMAIGMNIVFHDEIKLAILKALRDIGDATK